MLKRKELANFIHDHQRKANFEEKYKLFHLFMNKLSYAYKVISINKTKKERRTITPYV